MAQFWVMYGASRPLGIIALSGSVLTIHAKLILKSELSEFLSFIAWDKIECDCTGIFAVSNAISAPISNYSVQRFTPAISDEIKKIDIPPIQDEIKISELYDLLCEADSQFKDISVFDAWMCSISHRVRHGFSKVYGIFENDLLVSTAGVYTESDSSGVIESVATHPDFRNRGYASALVMQCVQLLQESGKTPFIVTSSLHAHEIYHKLGFRDFGTLFIMTRPQEN